MYTINALTRARYRPAGHHASRTSHFECFFLVATPERSHPFPSRTRKLSSPGPMVLQGQPCGRVGRCRGFEGSAKAGPSSLFRFSEPADAVPVAVARAPERRERSACAVRPWCVQRATRSTRVARWGLGRSVRSQDSPPSRRQRTCSIGCLRASSQPRRSTAPCSMTTCASLHRSRCRTRSACGRMRSSRSSARRARAALAPSRPRRSCFFGPTLAGASRTSPGRPRCGHARGRSLRWLARRLRAAHYPSSTCGAAAFGRRPGPRWSPHDQTRARVPRTRPRHDRQGRAQRVPGVAAAL